MTAPSPTRWGILGRTSVWIAVLLAAVGLAYANSLQGPLIFDDIGSIADNPSIRQYGTAFTPPPGSGRTVEARPLLNASLALNYALSGTEVWSYHLLNALIHAAAALALYGLVRRTLELPQLTASWAADAPIVAGLTALLWAVHPLQTESVAYIVQRAESMAGLFLLVCLYALARSESAGTAQARWRILSATSLFLGILTKEIAVVAVPLVFFYEGLFLGRGPIAFLRKHPFYCAALGISAVVLAFLMLSVGGNRSGSIGFGIGVTPWGYLLTQAEAIATYLRLSVVPTPLVLDYGAAWVTTPSSILGYAVLDLGILAGSLYLARHSPKAGFLVAWFWLILAPTSSVIPGNRQTIAEHRMYLPLAAVVAGAVIAAWTLLPRQRRLVVGVALGLAALGIGGTHRRNGDYAHLLTLYGKTARARPDNPYALNNYGFALGSAGRRDEAERALRASLRLWPTYAEAHYNLGVLLGEEGHLEAALHEYEQAAAHKPRYKEAIYNLGLALIQTGRPAEAAGCLEEVTRIDPAFSGGWVALANAEANSGHAADAVTHYHEALRRDPSNAEASYNLAMTLGQTGHPAEALAALAPMLASAPNARAEYEAGVFSTQLSQWVEARAHFTKALALQPDYPEAHLALGDLLALAGQPGPALGEYRAAATERPTYAEAYFSAGNVFARAGAFDRAVAQYETALRCRPDYPEAKLALSAARAARR